MVIWDIPPYETEHIAPVKVHIYVNWGHVIVETGQARHTRNPKPAKRASRSASKHLGDIQTRSPRGRKPFIWPTKYYREVHRFSTLSCYNYHSLSGCRLSKDIYIYDIYIIYIYILFININIYNIIIIKIINISSGSSSSSSSSSRYIIYL